MTTPRAILLAAAAMILAAGLLVWLAVPRYSLVNLGRGATMRLERASGALLFCQLDSCAPPKQGTRADPWAEFNEADPLPAGDGNVSSTGDH